MNDDILNRIDRLESIDAIRQLAAKYSLALDMRDADAWVGLFPADVKVGNGQTGRAALRQWFDETMRQQFDGTSHHIGGHIIEFD
ncbi:MAG: nuclear transport factor 2 family protein, partial [Pseudomonadota bacterium]